MSKFLQLITLINLSNSILGLIPICPNPTYQSLLSKSTWPLSSPISQSNNNRNQHALHLARQNFTPREPRPILVKKASITTSSSSSPSSSSFKTNPKATLNKSSIINNSNAATTNTNKPIPTVNRNARFSTQSSATNTLDQSSSSPQLERLQKVMSQAGISSRRNAEKLILDGRVTVNGKMVNEVGTKINPKVDILTVDGKKIYLDTSFGEQKKIFWIIIYKPRNYLTTTADNEKSQVEKEEKRETVMDLIPQARELRLLPIGRLERDTTGVLILTNENNWIHPLTHPSYKLMKKYEIIVEGIPSEAVLDTIRKDFVSGIDNSLIKGSEVLLADTDKRNNLACLEIQFEDSNTAKIQKMMEFIKHPIVSIKRTNFGPIELKGLKTGQWRELTSNDVEKLKLACTKAPQDETEEMKKILKRNARFNRRVSFNNNNKDDVTNNNRFSSSSSSSLRKAGAGYYSRTIGRGFSGYTAAPAIFSSGNDVSSSMSDDSSTGVGKGRGKRGRSFTKTASNGYSSSGGGGGSVYGSSRPSSGGRLGSSTTNRATATASTTSAWASSSSRRMQSQSSTAASTAPLRRSSTTPKIYKPSS